MKSRKLNRKSLKLKTRVDDANDMFEELFFFLKMSERVYMQFIPDRRENVNHVFIL